MAVTAGSGTTIATDDVSSVHYQRVKVVWGTDGVATDANASTPLPVVQTGSLPAGTAAIGKLAANSGVDIGDVDVTSVPADPFGANADAASATGSISAKLRFIASTGIPITGTVTVGSHAVTVASGGIASGAVASGAIATGAVASGAIASGAFASGAIGSGAIASGAVASGAVASGAFASGALAAGSIAAGAVAAGASSFVHLEDDASANLDAGVGMLAVRKATPADTSGSDGDYEFLQMSAGRLWASATIDAALPAGTNAIGKLAANSGVDIGDVDVTSVPADPFGANADAASATGSISAKLRFIAATGIPITGSVAVTNTPLTNFGAGEYETVAASQTAQVLGATGATGDYLAGVLVVPATTSPGNVIILDNATSITVFTGGASSVSNLVPFMIPLGMISISGAWKATTGANVSLIAIGNFT